MKVLFLTTSISRLGGGVSTYIVESARALINTGCDVQILTTVDPFFEEDCPADLPVKAFEKARLSGPYAYSGSLKRFAMQHCLYFDIIHTHTIWNHQFLVGGQIAKKCAKKLVCSIHGTLQSHCMSKSALRKRVLVHLYAYNILNSAACLHTTGLNEYNTLKSLRLRVPVCIVPIGLNAGEYGADDSLEDNAEVRRLVKDRKVILFLSRVSPIKGLVNLAEAWGRICMNFPEWSLVIAGPDDNGHLGEVQKTMHEFGAANQTTFVGPVYGDLKRRLYAACDLFVLPTHSENFGIVIAEALASGKPVVTTRTTPWKELETYNCGWWIDTGVESLEKALREALSLSDSQRQQMGKCGRKLIEDNYSWPRIAREMVGVYEWLLGSGEKPDCVRLD